MSTPKEKLQAIQHAVDIAKQRLISLEKKKALKTLTRSELYEIDMHKDCIARGEKILKDSK